MGLTLGRNVGEIIDIDPFGLGIELLVTRVVGQKAYICVKAPKHLPVHRREVTDEVRKRLQETNGCNSSTTDAAPTGRLESTEGGIGLNP